MFKKHHFDEWPETKFFEPAQLQLIVPTYFSDTTWIASDSTRAFLQKYACIANIQSISDEEVPEGCGIHKDVSNAQNVSIGFQLKTLFKRNVSFKLFICILALLGPLIGKRRIWTSTAQLEHRRPLRQSASEPV